MYDGNDQAPAPRSTGSGGPSRQSGGIPDGLLVGVLGLLLGITLLVWTGTGLAALLAHGHWPDHLAFTHSPMALRSLLTDPRDVAGAWPDVPAEQLPRPGLLWGLLVSQVMVLVVLAIAVTTSLVRRRARRRLAREARRSATRGTPHPPSKGDAAACPGLPEGATPPRGAPPARRNAAPGTATERWPDPADQPAAGSPSKPPQAPEAAPHHPVGTAAPASTSLAPTPPTAPSSAPPDRAAPSSAPPDGATPPADPTLLLLGAARGAPEPSPATGPRQPVLVYGAQHGHPDHAAQTLLDAPGPAVLVTSDPALWDRTAGIRAKHGPTHLYDPSQLVGSSARLRWSPHHGCEDMDTARHRAAAFLAPVRPRARPEAAVVDAAETLLRCCLHAAAVSGEPFRQVHRWATNGSPGAAVRTLRTHAAAASGAAGELESVLIAHPQRRDAATELLRRALGALSQLHVRNACTASRGDSVALESFVSEGGTLYLVGESIEDPRRHDPGTMPFLTALLSSVVEHGRRMAARSSSGRLDPPLTLVLDQVAVVAPLPELPWLAAEGAAFGLPTLALLRSEEQTRTWWPSLVNTTP